MKISTLLLSFLFSTCILELNAQKEEFYKGNIFNIALSYGYQIPFGDMADLYGGNFNVGLQFENQLANNYLFGLDGHYLFGTKVKQDVLVNLRDYAGDIYGNDKTIASIELRERGIYIGAYIGKIIPVTNPRSGIKLKLGAGFFQHWIRVQDNSNTVNQVYGEYEKGYDRLTFGLAFNPFVGYQYISSNRRINFYVGIDALLGLTEGRRDYQFDTMKPYRDKRFDGIVGLKAGWILPFFTTVHADEVYY